MSTSTSPRRQLVVGAIIVDDLTAPTRILAARRLTGPPAVAGRWEFPGGKVDPGETPEQALVRELQEELGFTARLGDELVNPKAPTWPIAEWFEMRLWFVVPESEPPTLGDVHSEIRWLSADQVQTLDWLDADLAVLPHIFG